MIIKFRSHQTILMFSKLLKSACLAALVTAERTEKLGPVTELPVAEVDNVKCEGVTGEALYTEGDD